MSGPDQSAAALRRAQYCLDTMPFARFMKVTAQFEDGQMICVAPFVPALIGNPIRPALHGGAVAAFMELTAQAHLATEAKRTDLPRPINVSVQYLRPGRPQGLKARARTNRIGRTIVNIDVTAWHDDTETAIATLQAHFLIKSR